MNLFLEGVSGSGKSTLLGECLLPYKNELGGFSSQRLWKEGYASYRIQPATVFELETEYIPDMEHVFRYYYKGTHIKDQDVFRYYGAELLERAAGYKLILLDEIGGAELLVPEFREKLYSLLKGPYNCIGVLKLSEKARYMKNGAGYSDDLLSFNNEVRDLISSLPDSKLLYFERERKNEIKAEIDEFLQKIFKAV